jgi:hypothetical protein
MSQVRVMAERSDKLLAEARIRQARPMPATHINRRNALRRVMEWHRAYNGRGGWPLAPAVTQEATLERQAT